MQYVLLSYGQQTAKMQVYQESDGANVIRYADVNGNTLPLPNINEVFVIDPNPPLPAWGNKNLVYVLGVYLTRQPTAQAYIEVNRFTDINGNTIDFISLLKQISTVSVQDWNPPIPQWGVGAPVVK